MNPVSRRANAKYVRRSWQDYSSHRARSNTTLHFSWKPELHTDADAVALRERFCVSPPEIAYIGKGMHDACRHHVTSLKAHAAHAERSLRQLAKALRCLPPTTLVVLRTPYYVADNGTDARSRRVCNNASSEPARIKVVRDVMVRLHRSRLFGRALLLDAFAITRAATLT